MIRSWRRAAHRCIALAALAALAAPRAASAGDDGARVSLVWRTPEGSDCPSRDEVIEQVQRLVGPAPTREQAPVRASAEVHRDAGGRFRVELVTWMGSSQGVRVIEERSCRAMAEATVVILAWMIDPEAMAAREGATGAGPATPGPPPPPRAPDAASASPAPVPAPSRQRSAADAGDRITLMARLAAAGDLGTLPGASLGVGARVALGRRRVRLGLHGALWPGRSTTIASGPEGTPIGGSFALAVVGVEGCGEPTALPVALCGGLELDHLTGTGLGVRFPASASATWLSFSAGLDARFSLLGPLGAAAHAALLIPTRRERFAIDDVGLVHRPSAVAGRASLGLELSF
ncbi:hypothetical protein [Sorangium sp. So ce385]|uniref:hypothetical protein n=1 Tax=Sorangium sp. So ce385 TaxID=3133308 RepID=UPI003F5B0F46